MLGILFLIVMLIVWLLSYNHLHPVRKCDISVRTMRYKYGFRIIARCGLRWIVEHADYIQTPIPGDKTCTCVIVEGVPQFKFPKMRYDEVTAMQNKLARHLVEYDKEWLRVTEVMQPNPRR